MGFGRPARWARDAIFPAEDPLSLRARLDHEHLRLLLAFVLKPDSNCLDVGANVGDVLGEIVRLAPRGRHIAYEPLPHLGANLASRFAGVDVRIKALSDSEGDATFHWVRNGEGYSGLFPRNYPFQPEIAEIVVPTERLDEHIPESWAPTLVKIDVEGGELHVMRGAVEMLRRYRPWLVFEFGRGTQPWTGIGAQEVFDFIEEVLEYRIFDMDGNGPYTRVTFCTTQYYNFVAHP